MKMDESPSLDSIDGAHGKGPLPRFSVVIPLFNKGSHIERTIRSVLAQTSGEFELLVVDDGSTDDSVSVVASLSDPRLALLQKRNGGESSARNYGIRAARAEYIAFLDADDCWDAGFLEHIEALIHKFPVAGVYCTRIRDSQKGGRDEILASSCLPEIGGTGLIHDYIECLASGIFPVTSSSVCIKKSVLSDVGMFNESLAIGPDLDMWLRVYLHSGIAIANIFSATYHTDAENRSVHRTDFDQREIDLFRHFHASYGADRLNSTQLLTMRDWVSRRVAQVIRRAASNGNARFALQTLRANLSVMKTQHSLFALMRILVPNELVRVTRNLAGG